MHLSSVVLVVLFAELYGGYCACVKIDVNGVKTTFVHLTRARQTKLLV